MHLIKKEICLKYQKLYNDLKNNLNFFQIGIGDRYGKFKNNNS